MQLARNVFFQDQRTEQTLGRKVKEAIAAIQLDRHYSKDELVESYLNIVYYGENVLSIRKPTYKVPNCCLSDCEREETGSCQSRLTPHQA